MNKKHEFRMKVRYIDVDGMKIVHNSRYFVYFEEARLDLVEKENYPYKQIEDDGFIVPISESRIFYKKSIYYGEEVAVITWLEYLKNFSMKFKYKIVKDDGAIACEGYTIHAFIKTDTMDFIELPEKLKDILIKYVENS